MQCYQSLPTVLSCLILVSLSCAQCVQDHRSNKTGGILVSNFTITGTQKLTSAEIARIAGELTEACFDEDSEEMEERVRMLFQNRGYFKAEVKSVRIKPVDPLTVPKPVTLEAEVAEGPRYRLGTITFVNNHAFSGERLRQEFPLKRGGVFDRDAVASGLESLRKVYCSNGFLDETAIPETQVGSNAIMSLNLSVDEGVQYHLNRVEILAKKQLAAKLRTEWKLDEGSIYDCTYIDKYIEANRDSLPVGFERSDVQVVTNCPKALVEVRLNVEPPEDTPQPLPKGVPCESKQDVPK